jgi:hypothetical protein
MSDFLFIVSSRKARRKTRTPEVRAVWGTEHVVRFGNKSCDLQAQLFAAMH